MYGNISHQPPLAGSQLGAKLAGPPSELSFALEQLGVTITCAEGAASQLERSLLPLRRPGQDTTASVDPVGKATSPVTSQLVEMAHRIRTLERRLLELNSSLVCTADDGPY